ncbi:unnamed protein product [Allacma fusca]|uniref:Cytochrome P450 n=1 Tax=Allacma fusca TaxID=39272 RepID=A0A8J2KCM6_9HEXA|nr:unnamed protein product [Allacma fusca]
MIPGLILVAVGLVFWEYLIRPRQFVPGPRGIPILGHLHLLGPQPHKTFIKWKKLYGPMIGIWLGSFRTVVIQDAKLVREGLNLSAFSGRPALKAITVARSGGVAKGIFFTDGREWSEQRRFALRALREVGFGTKHMEGKVQEGIQELLETLKGKEGEPIQARSVFQAAVVSALWRILFGRHVDQQNPEFKDAINRISS